MSGTAWLRLASVLGGLAVGLGAFGAHGLKERLETLQTTAIYHTAVQYHFYHALALLAVALLALQGRSGSALAVAGWSFAIGVLVFSGTLYGLALSGVKWLGAITPIGGVALILGWVALAVAAGGAAKPTTGTAGL